MDRPADRPDFVRMQEALEQRIPFYETLWLLRDDRGLIRHHVVSGEPVHRGGRFMGFQRTTRDLTELRRAIGANASDIAPPDEVPPRVFALR